MERGVWSYDKRGVQKNPQKKQLSAVDLKVLNEMISTDCII